MGQESRSVGGRLRGGGDGAFNAGPGFPLQGSWQFGHEETLPNSASANSDLLRIDPTRWPRRITPRTRNRWSPAHPRGATRFCLIYWEISQSSGSGSNTWTTTPKAFLGAYQPPPSWAVMDLPSAPHTPQIAPNLFTEADLPVTGLYILPRHLCTCEFAVQFARVGAGTNVLSIRYWLTR